MGTGERAMTLRALFSLAFAAWIGSQFAGYGTSRTAAAVTYVLILVVSVTLHEVAHAVVARAVGARVTGMRLGFGPRLTPAGSWLDLRPIVVAAHVSYLPPTGATTWAARTVARSRRSQLLAIASAGLVLHVVLIVVALALGLDHTWVRELAWANVLALASNAIPLAGSVTSTTGGPNDGAHIVALLRRPDLPKAWVADHQHAEAECLAMLTGGDVDPARVAHAAARAEAAMTAVPPTAAAAERAGVARTLAMARLLQGRYVETRDLCTWALAATEGADRAAVLATLGWAQLGLGDRSGADELLRQAMTLHRGPLVEAFAQRLASTPV